MFIIVYDSVSRIIRNLVTPLSNTEPTSRNMNSREAGFGRKSNSGSQIDLIETWMLKNEIQSAQWDP